MSSTSDPPGGSRDHPHPTEDNDTEQTADLPTEDVGSNDEASAQRSADSDPSTENVDSGAPTAEPSTGPDPPPESVGSNDEATARSPPDPDPSPESIGANDEAASQSSTDPGLFNDDVKELHRLLRSMGDRIEKDSESEDLKEEHERMLDILARPLTEAQINARAPTWDKETALHIAAEEGLLKAAEDLIDRRASVSSIDVWKMQPLHYASMRGQLDMAKLLLQKGAVILAVDDEGQSSLHLAAKWGEAAVVKYLLSQNKFDIEKTSSRGWTPLHHASWWGRSKDTIEALLQDGASISALTEDGQTPLMLAVRENEEVGVDALLGFAALSKDKKQLEKADSEGFTPLMRCIQKRFSKGVNKLLAADANCNAALTTGESCLHWAMWRFSDEIFEKLMQKDTLNLDATDNDGKTALHYICGARNRKNGERCHMAEDDESGDGNDGPREPKHLGIMQWLLHKNANANLKTSKGETTLYFAAKKQGLDSIGILLENMKAEVAIKTLETRDVRDKIFRKLLFLVREETAQEAENSEAGNSGAAEAVLRFIRQSHTLSQRALFWAAVYSDRHLLVSRILSYDGVDNGRSEPKRSAIEWATLNRMPRILWWLVATSHRTSETDKQIEKAGKWLKQGLSTRYAAQGLSVSEPWSEKTDKHVPAKQMTLEYILAHPPIGQFCLDGSSLEAPDPDYSKSKACKDFKCNIVGFYMKDRVSSRVEEIQSVDTAIHKPASLTELMRNKARELGDSVRLDEKIIDFDMDLKQIGAMSDRDSLGFTWIHLPVTNVRNFQVLSLVTDVF